MARSGRSACAFSESCHAVVVRARLGLVIFFASSSTDFELDLFASLVHIKRSSVTTFQ